MYYDMKKHILLRYQPARNAKKKYEAVLQRVSDKKLIFVPFGDSAYESFQDATELNLYTVHNDPVRRRLYRGRHHSHLRTGYYSPGAFSFHLLW
jgi:hypothetical protein